MKDRLGNSQTSSHRAEWMNHGSFGVMVHYLITPEGQNETERERELDRIVDGFCFDVFLEQFVETGADWLIFTVGQNSGYYVSPNHFLDERLPGHTSKRDLVLELARAIKARQKRFIAYLPADVAQSDSVKRVFAWDTNDMSQFQRLYADFIKAYSTAYGLQVDGWWMDGCWIHPERFGDWTDWMAAFRAGNPNSAVAVSPGPSAYPMTLLQDYLAGETYQLPSPTPSSRFVEGVQWHALLPIDSSFVGGQPNAYSDELLFTWVRQCKKAGGAVTLNVPIDETGKMSQKSVAQLNRLARDID